MLFPQVLGLQIETQAIEKAGDDDKAIRKICHHVFYSRSGIRFRNELLVGRRKLHHPGVVNLPKDFPQIIQEILILRKITPVCEHLYFLIRNHQLEFRLQFVFEPVLFNRPVVHFHGAQRDQAVFKPDQGIGKTGFIVEIPAEEANFPTNLFLFLLAGDFADVPEINIRIKGFGRRFPQCPQTRGILTDKTGKDDRYGEE